MSPNDLHSPHESSSSPMSLLIPSFIHSFLPPFTITNSSIHLLSQTSKKSTDQHVSIYFCFILKSSSSSSSSSLSSSHHPLIMLEVIKAIDSPTFIGYLFKLRTEECQFRGKLFTCVLDPNLNINWVKSMFAWLFSRIIDHEALCSLHHLHASTNHLHHYHNPLDDDDDAWANIMINHYMTLRLTNKYL